MKIYPWFGAYGFERYDWIDDKEGCSTTEKTAFDF